MATKYTSQQVWNLRDSLRRAKARTSLYFEQKRALETRVRDLERSRDLWRRKFEGMTQSAHESEDSPPRP